MSNVKRLLASVGKKSFVEFYEEYRHLYRRGSSMTKEDKHRLAETLLRMNPEATTIQGQFTRINTALRIFKNGWHTDALEEVIASTHPSISIELKDKAIFLLKHEV
ncbi:hypothetical protein [Rossellomorea sp. NPDC077527]|uniref:hypothetical protein n=1 Tax=Rossellomorea sp. NPDC077527 TaxID=3364510 RepID=UPI0037C74E9B